MPRKEWWLFYPFYPYPSSVVWQYYLLYFCISCLSESHHHLFYHQDRNLRLTFTFFLISLIQWLPNCTDVTSEIHLEFKNHCPFAFFFYCFNPSLSVLVTLTSKSPISFYLIHCSHNPKFLYKVQPRILTYIGKSLCFQDMFQYPEQNL